MEPIIILSGNEQGSILKDGLIICIEKNNYKSIQDGSPVVYFGRKFYGRRFPDYEWIAIIPNQFHFYDEDIEEPQFYFGGVNMRKAEFMERLQESFSEDFLFMQWNPDLFSGVWISNRS
jgi:hypothetical protein